MCQYQVSEDQTNQFRSRIRWCQNRKITERAISAALYGGTPLVYSVRILRPYDSEDDEYTSDGWGRWTAPYFVSDISEATCTRQFAVRSIITTRRTELSVGSDTSVPSTNTLSSITSDGKKLKDDFREWMTQDSRLVFNIADRRFLRICGRRQRRQRMTMHDYAKNELTCSTHADAK
jgi:hypothetical protein